MLYLFSQDELNRMSTDELDAVINASWVMTEAHKSFIHKNHLWSEGSIMVDSQLVNSWSQLSAVYINRLVASRHCWKAVYVAAIETKKDIDSEVSRLWESIAEIARLSDTDSLTSHDFWNMCDCVNDVIYDKSDQPGQDHKSFDREFFRQKSNKGRVRVCRKWFSAGWQFGIPEFRSK